MKEFKVCLHIEEKILDAVKIMVEHDFTLVEDPTQCDVFLTDVYTMKNKGPVNILIVDSSQLPKFKGVEDLNGFNHYVIFNELSFLEQRVKKAIIRQWEIQKGQEQTYTGVSAILSLEESTSENGGKLPLYKDFIIKSSRERKTMANELEKFFEEIDALVDFKNPVVVQNAIEIQEELLMNAIWDANPKYSSQPRSTPVELEQQEEVTLQWAFNGKELAISVKDPFGKMKTDIMEKYIDFIFKTGRKLDYNLSNQKVSAGLGMYMILQRANLLSVFVADGRITDVGIVLIIKGGKRSATITSKAIDIINVK